MTLKQRIKIISEIVGINLGDVAYKLGMSQSTFCIRLKTGKFTKEELNSIASNMKCEYISYFKFDNGAKVSAITTGEEVRKACEFVNLTATELGKKMGISQPAISKRLKTGKFSLEELNVIARKIGCEYYSKFKLDNGMEI